MPPNRHERVRVPGNLRGSIRKEGRSKKLIFLAQSIKQHPAETRADLQRYFGLNLDRLGADFSAFHAGACLSNLPLGSSLLSAIDPRCQWTQQEYMLFGILRGLSGKEISFPWEKSGGIEGVETEAVPLDQFKDWYENTTWKEVDEWQEIQ